MPHTGPHSSEPGNQESVLLDTTSLASWPPALRSAAAAAARRARDQNLVERIWRKDASVWSDRDEAKWLDWLSVDAEVEAALGDLALEAREKGWRQIVLLGMGGSSLGAEVLERVLRADGDPQVELIVLDSTDPDRIAAVANRLNPSSAVMICASKSGSTLETAILSRYFETLLPPERCLAVTDPGSALAAHAERHEWRHTFLGRPEIGGRFSVLSVFGQVPAAAAGLPIGEVVRGAAAMRAACELSELSANPGLVTGIALATAANLGRNKLRLVSSDRWAVFRLWMEQLIAESTGKGGRGIVPITWCDDDAADVLTVRLRAADAGVLDQRMDQPVLDVEIGAGLVAPGSTAAQLGAEFFRWQFATAVAGALLGLHPFDQPDVELAKVKAREITSRMMAGESSGAPTSAPTREELLDFFEGMVVPQYLGVLIFLPVDAELQLALDEFADVVREQRGVSVTWGEGPRYLHSTGQAHKGGPPQGRFLVVSRRADAHEAGARVPTSSEVVPGLRFAAVQAAQAAGDGAALRERGRAVLDVGFDDAAQAADWLRSAKSWLSTD